MKKLLTLSAAFLCAQSSLLAQGSNVPHAGTGKSPVTAGKTTAAGSRLVAMSWRYFDNGSLQPSDSNSMVYTNPAFGMDDKTGRWKYATGSWWQYAPAGYYEYYKDKQQYDAKGRLVANSAEVYSNGKWSDNDNTTYTYDGQGNVATETRGYYNGTGWDSTRYTYAYDGNNRILTKKVEGFHGQWGNMELATYAYNGQLLATSLTQRWNKNAMQWDDDTRITNTYNGNLLTEALTEAYNGTGWTGTRRTNYVYDAKGNNTLEERFMWTGTAWQPLEKLAHGYNSLDQRVTTEQEIWIALTGVYMKVNRHTTTYNTLHQPLVELSEKWNPNTGKYELQANDVEYRYYYEPYNTTGVKDAGTAAAGLSVYPVPAHHTLHLRATLGDAQPAMVVMTDVTGRTVKQLQLPAAKQHSADVDVSALPAGSYIIRIEAGGTMLSQKVLVR